MKTGVTVLWCMHREHARESSKQGIEKAIGGRRRRRVRQTKRGLIGDGISETKYGNGVNGAITNISMRLGVHLPSTTSPPLRTINTQRDMTACDVSIAEEETRYKVTSWKHSRGISQQPFVYFQHVFYL